MSALLFTFFSHNHFIGVSMSHNSLLYSPLDNIAILIHGLRLTWNCSSVPLQPQRYAFAGAYDSPGLSCLEFGGFEPSFIARCSRSHHVRTTIAAAAWLLGDTQPGDIASLASLLSILGIERGGLNLLSCTKSDIYREAFFAASVSLDRFRCFRWYEGAYRAVFSAPHYTTFALWQVLPPCTIRLSPRFVAFEQIRPTSRDIFWNFISCSILQVGLHHRAWCSLSWVYIFSGILYPI